MKRFANMLPIVSVILGIGAFLLCFAISFQSWGVEQGLVAGEIELDEYRSIFGDQRINFSGGVSRTYERLSSEYGFLSVLFLALVLGNVTLLISRNVQLNQVIFGGIVFAILLILYRLWIMIRDKEIVGPYFWEAARNQFAKLTITYDWILVITVLILLGIQVLGVAGTKTSVGEIQQ